MDPPSMYQKEYPNANCNQVLQKALRTYQRVQKRFNQLQPSERLGQLAEPKLISRKFKPEIFVWNSKQRVDIYRPDERVISTRLEQLAYPRVRYILDIQSRFQNIVCPERHYIYNRHVRKSLFTLYSRLANVKPPIKRILPKQWTAEQWKKKTKKYKRLSLPKRVFKPPKICRKGVPLKELMKRIKKLARPKKRKVLPPFEWSLTPELKNYKASKRTKALAQPIERAYEGPAELPIPITEEALTYKISNRTKELSEHRERSAKDSDQKENPFSVSPNALKAKAKERTKKLAKPRDIEEPAENKEPWKVSKNALKAKASVRLIELAKPRGSS